MSSAKNLIKSALAQAQAYAATHQKYAGIRFQVAGDFQVIGGKVSFHYNAWKAGKQYLVLIESFVKLLLEYFHACHEVVLLQIMNQ